MKEDIIGILKEASSGIDDGFGGIETGVFEETFEEVAEDIIKMIVSSYEINGLSRLLGEKIIKEELLDNLHKALNPKYANSVFTWQTIATAIKSLQQENKTEATDRS